MGKPVNVQDEHAFGVAGGTKRCAVGYLMLTEWTKKHRGPSQTLFQPPGNTFCASVAAGRKP